jgi:hypothetical protein
MGRSSKGLTLFLIIMIFFSIFALLQSFSFVFASSSSKTIWNVETVDKNVSGFGNGYCPLVVDSNNNPHLVYEGLDSQYALRNDTRWNLQSIPQVEVPYDMVLDTNDNPHIIYLGQKGLMYATWTGVNWKTEIVDESFLNGYGSIILDASGNPHIAYTSRYRQNSIYSLKYGSLTGHSWLIQTIEESENIPFRTSIAIDESNVTFLMYGYTTKHGGGSYWDSQTVKLAINKNSNWTIQTVVSDITNYSNMVLDMKGFPHFAYQVQKREIPWTNTISYASWNGSMWKMQSVVSNVSLIVNLANINMGGLALDAQGYPHLNYVTSKPNSFFASVMYASWTGNQWEIKTVDSNHIANGECYLSLDSNGSPHMSYLVTPSGTGMRSRTVNIMYATMNMTTPIEPLPSAPTSTVTQTFVLITILSTMAIMVAILLINRKYRNRKPLSV